MSLRVDNRVKIWCLALSSVVVLMQSAIVSADYLSERSLQLSTSSAGAASVDYTLKFQPAKTANSLVLDFCTNTPTISQACNAPAGFSVSSASSTTTGVTDVTAIDSNTVTVTGSIDPISTVEITLESIVNPVAAGTLYARIITYDTRAHALAYSSENINTGVVDTGSVATAITDTIGVTGSVPESMTFCISGSSISSDCTGVTPTALELGEGSGSDKALSTTKISEGNVYVQVSTNALGGSVVRLKSNATDCGGLIRKDAPTGSCEIAPSQQDGIAAGEAKFGIKTATATDAAASATGVLQPFAGSGYNNNSFTMNFTSGNTSGVTSPFGDPFLGTAGQPASNKNMALTFGASISNDTPAGRYFVDISLIATGKF